MSKCQEGRAANALRPVCDSRAQAAAWQPSHSALSGSDRHDVAASQGLDIANWGPAKESPVLAIELLIFSDSFLRRRMPHRFKFRWLGCSRNSRSLFRFLAHEVPITCTRT